MNTRVAGQRKQTKEYVAEQLCMDTGNIPWLSENRLPARANHLVLNKEFRKWSEWEVGGSL